MILIEAGPLVALVKADDQHHAECKAAFRLIRQPLGTVWPVLTEVMFLLADIPGAQEAVWEMIVRGAIRVLPLDSSDVPRIREVMRKYSDRAIDLADAALIAVAEREGIRHFFTVDQREFAVYRLYGRIRPVLISL